MYLENNKSSEDVEMLLNTSDIFNIQKQIKFQVSRYFDFFRGKFFWGNQYLSINKIFLCSRWLDGYLHKRLKIT